MEPRTITWELGARRRVILDHTGPRRWFVTLDTAGADPAVASATSFAGACEATAELTGLAVELVRRELVPLHCYAVIGG